MLRKVLDERVRMKTFVSGYYLQDAGGQSPYTLSAVIVEDLITSDDN